MEQTIKIELRLGDSLKVLKEFPDNYFGSVVTDPPYGLKFMNSIWDYDVPSTELWKEILRVLKPGGHLLSFFGTRTYHRGVLKIEDAGFEIRDMINWIHSQGMPKSYNIAKGIDKHLGIKGKSLGTKKERGSNSGKNRYNWNNPNDLKDRTFYEEFELESEEAKLWDGWGTNLKPANEPIVLARKPISEKTIVENILKWGVGGINIDSSRIELNGEIVPINKLESWSGFGQIKRPNYTPTENTKGRWPANILFDEESGKILEKQYKGASRFFYCSKPNKKEVGELNDHPTVKPVELMKYLVLMVTPIYEICLDPFAGSFTTGIACKELNIDFVGIEKEKEYFELGKTRIENW